MFTTGVEHADTEGVCHVHTDHHPHACVSIVLWGCREQFVDPLWYLENCIDIVN